MNQWATWSRGPDMGQVTDVSQFVTQFEHTEVNVTEDAVVVKQILPPDPMRTMIIFSVDQAGLHGVSTKPNVPIVGGIQFTNNQPLTLTWPIHGSVVGQAWYMIPTANNGTMTALVTRVKPQG